MQAQVSAGFVASRYLRDAGEIERVFRALRDQRASVQVRFFRPDAEYTARVLEVTSTQFLLDDIRPRAGISLMRDGEPFSLAGRVDGTYAHVEELRVAKVAVDRGVPCFVLELPTEILYQQRRRAPRFRLPQTASKERARLTMYRADHALAGYLVDISAGGCRVVFDVQSDPGLRLNELVERCELEIPGHLHLTAQTVIRHFSMNEQTGQFVCGIQFAEMGSADRRRLRQFIARLVKTAGSP
ncbi:MAG TPA: PilZ domain-containing protein [Pseudomonadales bacterium]